MFTDNFIDIEFTKANLDSYYIRTAIFNGIKEYIKKFDGDLLDIGCGKMPYKKFLLENSNISNYIGLDIENAIEYAENIKPDYKWDGITMPFSDNEFESAFATEVLEHCPQPNIVLHEINRVLKPGGIFFFTVPFLWPLHEVPHDEFRFTPFSLERCLSETGFDHIQLKASGGWHASMAQMLGLWVRRSQLGSRKRAFLSALLKPIVKYLIKKDKTLPVNFKESQMITGLYGVAYKKV